MLRAIHGTPLQCSLWTLNPTPNRGTSLIRNRVDVLRHSLRAICAVLLNPRDPLLQSERMQSFAADPVYVKGEVTAYVGRNQNLKDLKDRKLRA